MMANIVVKVDNVVKIKVNASRKEVTYSGGDGDIVRVGEEGVGDSNDGNNGWCDGGDGGGDGDDGGCGKCGGGAHGCHG